MSVEVWRPGVLLWIMLVVTGVLFPAADLLRIDWLLIPTAGAHAFTVVLWCGLYWRWMARHKKEKK